MQFLNTGTDSSHGSIPRALLESVPGHKAGRVRLISFCADSAQNPLRRRPSSTCYDTEVNQSEVVS